MRLLGAVLAGGQSRRFGSDKAEALFRGKRLIDCAAEALRNFCEDVVVVGRSDMRWTSVPDAPQPNLGPLGGLCGALLYAVESDFDAVLVMPCDTPALPDTAAQSLIALSPAVLASQPVIGCWPVHLRARLCDHLSAERYSVRSWCEEVSAAQIDGPPLPNINVPADLRSLR